VQGADGLVRLFGELPGDWHLAVRRVVADDQGGSSVVDATIDGESRWPASRSSPSTKQAR
jgi:hypothetical protein